MNESEAETAGWKECQRERDGEKEWNQSSIHTWSTTYVHFLRMCASAYENLEMQWQTMSMKIK